MTKVTELPSNISDCSIDDPKKLVKDFAKRMLKTTIFVGNFQEKRFVESLNEYRDIVKIAAEETIFLSNLNKVKKRITDEYLSKIWIGITEPQTIGAPAGHCLWVQLDEQVLGTYWYSVKSVIFTPNEIYLKLKVLRPYCVDGQIVTSRAAESHIESNDSRNDCSTSIQNDITQYLTETVGTFCKEVITLKNIREAAIFLAVTTATLATFAIKGTQWLLEYLLKFMHEFQGIIKATTPIFQSFFKMILHVINGFYFLIGFMWKDYRYTKPNTKTTYVAIKQYNSPQVRPYRREPITNYAHNPNGYYVEEVE